jgi:hypothetical protein
MTLIKMRVCVRRGLHPAHVTLVLSHCSRLTALASHTGCSAECQSAVRIRNTCHIAVSSHCSHHFKQRLSIADFRLTPRQDCAMSDDAELVQRNSAREMQSIDLSGRQVLMSGTALKEVGPLSSISPCRRLFLCCAHPTPTLEASTPFGRVVSPSAGPLSRHVRQRGQRNEIAVCNAAPALDRARCKPTA